MDHVPCRYDCPICGRTPDLVCYLSNPPQYKYKCCDLETSSSTGEHYAFEEWVYIVEEYIQNNISRKKDER